MKKTIKVLLLSFLFLITGCSSVISSNNSENPSVVTSNKQTISANFYIGGLTGAYNVIIKNDELSYKNSRKISNPKWVSMKLSKQDIVNLEKVFINYNASNWNSSYIKPRVQDGTYWRLIYSSENLSFNSRGQNKYPDNFKEITRYISTKLLHGKPFK